MLRSTAKIMLTKGNKGIEAYAGNIKAIPLKFSDVVC